jgi:hypothetical protein
MYRIIFLLLITSASFGQVLQETNGSRAENRIVHKLGFRLPQVCWVTGNPNLLNYSAFMSKGAMVYDTCAGKIKRWSGSAWISIQDSTAGGSGDYVDTIYRKAGQDSIFFTINGGTERAIKDSLGSGGSTTPGGGTYSIQYNRAGAFAGNTRFLFDSANLRVAIGKVVFTPSYTLHVLDSGSTFAAGGLRIQSKQANQYAQIFTENSAGKIAGFYNYGASYPTYGNYAHLYADGTGTLIDMGLGGIGAGRAVWTPAGLTIGSYTPGTARLNVNYSATIGGGSGIRVNNTSNNAGAYTPVEMLNDANVLSQLFLGSSAFNQNGVRPSGGGWTNAGSGGFSFIAYNASADITFHTNSSFLERLRIDQNGGVSIGTVADAAASSLLEITSTTKGFLRPRQTTAQRNAIASPAAGLSVYNSSLATNDVYTTAWYQQPNGLTGSGTLDFPSTGAHSSSDLTITVTGAADGDIVILGVPNVSVTNESNYSAWVSAANTVTVRYNHYGSGTNNPASGTFKVYVIKN